jgi:hypothetical protein
MMVSNLKELLSAYAEVGVTMMSTFSRTLAQWWRHRVLQAMECIPLRASEGPEGNRMHSSEGIGTRLEGIILGAPGQGLEGNGMHAFMGNGLQCFNGMHSPKGAVLLSC